MKFNKLVIPAALAGLAACGTSTAAMDGMWSVDNPGFYAGAGIGVDRVQGDEFPNQNDDVESTNTTYKVPFGFRLNRMFAFEGQYINFGTADSEDGRNEVEADGWTAGAIVNIPVWERVIPYVKGGVLFWQSDRRFPAGGAQAGAQQERDGNGTDFTYGVGVKFPMTERIDFRVEFERFQFGDFDDTASNNHVDGVDVDNASAVVVFNF